MLALAFNLTTTTTITIMSITPTGTEIPTIRGIFNFEDSDGLNPLATNPLEATVNPAKLAEDSL